MPVPVPGDVPDAPPVAEALVGAAVDPSAVNPPDVSVSCGMLLGEEAGEAVDLDGEGVWILEDWEGVGDDAGGCELVGFAPT